MRGKQWIWVIGSIVVIGVAVLAMVAGGDSESTPRRAALSQAGCTSSEAVKITGKLRDPAQRAADAINLILSASRPALTDIAADMQAIRRDVTGAEIPPCGERVRALMVDALDAEIDGILLLQAGANEAAADKLDEATRINLLLPDEIARLVP